MFARSAVAIAGSALVVLAGAMPAAAHVGVEPAKATEGSYPKLSFTVPTERVDADTTKIEIRFPEGYTFLGMAKPTPGWKVKVHKTGDGVGEGATKVTWTAMHKAVEIKPDQYERFELMMGALPKVDKIYFPAIQTYDSGEVVRWDEVPSAENPKPAHPAPVLTVVPADGAEADVSASGVSLDNAAVHAEEGILEGAPLHAASVALLLLGAGGLTTRAVLRRRAVRGAGQDS